MLYIINYLKCLLAYYFDIMIFKDLIKNNSEGEEVN